MSSRVSPPLSRRERQILDVLYRRSHASVAQVLESLLDPPSYSTVRALLNILEQKGHVSHREEGAHYVYAPTQPRHSAARSALSQVVATFFGGSVEHAVATLLSESDTHLSDEELSRLETLIQQAKDAQASGFEGNGI